MYGCRLGTKYISRKERITHSPAFESTIVKIQDGNETSLTTREREVVECLKKCTQTRNEEIEDESQSIMASRLAKPRKICSNGSEYIETSFILGSAAEIERLFSIGKNVLSQNRCALTPQMFEVLLFLRFNDRLWDAQLVAAAIQCSRGQIS